MKVAQTVAAIVVALGALSTSSIARADNPADDYLNPQDPGPRLSFMPIIGPGFRAVYDHRFQFNEVEQEISEFRTQLIGDVVFPYSEVSANADLRLFLLTFGVSAGYHNEWHVLQFKPNYDEALAGLSWGRDLAGARQSLGPAPVGGGRNPNLGPFGFEDLTRDARRVKDQNADVQSDQWMWYEGRLGFLVPAQNFMGVSTAALRLEDRPDVSYDWANATVLNGGLHLRWETYALFRHPRIGFIGPALRIMNMPRNRLQANLQPRVGGLAYRTASAGAACQPSPDIPCEEVRETEIAYGIVGGFRPNWAGSNDVFLTRIYTTLGYDDGLFGTHLYGLPLSLLFAYQVDFAL